MDKGQIVFVPEAQDSGKIKDLKWIIIVTDQKIMDVGILSLSKKGPKYKVSDTF
jgi:hypothetical protein